MTRAAIYARISRDPGDTRLGVKRQEADCRELVERKGWTVAELYVDNDVSAAKVSKRRPAYERMLDDIKTGSIDAVVVWDLDRLHRRPAELEQFFDACDGAGLNKIASVGGDVDLSTGEGLLVARIKGAVAAEEVRKLRERTRRKHLELAQAGRSAGGGTRAFGYTADRSALVDVEAAVIREAAERILAGETLRSIVMDWKRRGVATVSGRAWQTYVLKRILTSYHTAGIRSLHDVPVAPGQWPRILDTVTHDRLRAVLLDPARRKNRGARRYLLTGLLRCGLCEAKMVARPKGDKRRAYVCATGPGFFGCGHMAALALPLESEVHDRLVAVVDGPELEDAISDRAAGAGRDLVDAIGADEAALEQLARDFYAERSIDRRQFTAASTTLQQRLEAARGQLATVEREKAAHEIRGRLAESWDDLGLDRQRAVLATWVTAVVLSPAVKGRNFFDPTRVSVRWRI